MKTNNFLKGKKLMPSHLYFGIGIFLFSLLGLRDIIIPSLIKKFISSPALTGLMTPVYWIGLILGGAILALYFRSNPVQFYPGISSRDLFLWLILASPFLYTVIIKRLFLDFWIDEVLSITRHIQPSIQSALLWYPAPNNHIFSNALTGLYTQLIGATDLLTLLANPLILRSLYFASGVFTIITLAYTAHRFINPRAGQLTLVMLCTTIPWLNFITQVRGYSFSMLFASLMLMFLLQYRERKYRRDALSIGLLSGMMFYTMPSNLYYAAAIGLFFGLWGSQNGGEARKKNGHGRKKSLP